MKTILICHENDEIDLRVIAPWLASFSDLAGIILIRERMGRMRARIQREIKRNGPLRFLDVLAFRFYYKLFLSRKDKQWEEREIARLSRDLQDISGVPRIVTHSPNSPEVEKFLAESAPDIVVARCKTILKRRIFDRARVATVVFHPGICPEYRNSHGCFWALSREEYEKVGMTLLKIDEGVDTGPVYGYFSYEYDPCRETHAVIQTKVVTENLSALESKLKEIFHGTAVPIDVGSRASNAFGQPWLSEYIKIRKRVRKRRAEEIGNLASGQ